MIVQTHISGIPFSSPQPFSTRAPISSCLTQGRLVTLLNQEVKDLKSKSNWKLAMGVIIGAGLGIVATLTATIALGILLPFAGLLMVLIFPLPAVLLGAGGALIGGATAYALFDKSAKVEKVAQQLSDSKKTHDYVTRKEMQNVCRQLKDLDFRARLWREYEGQ